MGLNYIYIYICMYVTLTCSGSSACGIAASVGDAATSDAAAAMPAAAAAETAGDEPSRAADGAPAAALMADRDIAAAAGPINERNMFWYKLGA